MTTGLVSDFAGATAGVAGFISAFGATAAVDVVVAGVAVGVAVVAGAATGAAAAAGVVTALAFAGAAVVLVVAVAAGAAAGVVFDVVAVDWANAAPIANVEAITVAINLFMMGSSGLLSCVVDLRKPKTAAACFVLTMVPR